MGEKYLNGRCFMVFLNPYRQMPGSYLETGYDLFLPHPFQFGCAIVMSVTSFAL
jgi:hypothetical protein